MSRADAPLAFISLAISSCLIFRSGILTFGLPNSVPFALLSPFPPTITPCSPSGVTGLRTTPRFCSECLIHPFSRFMAKTACAEIHGICVTRTVVLPLSMSEQKHSCHREAAVLVSKAAKMSSSSNTGALEYSALARATRDLCPPDEKVSLRLESPVPGITWSYRTRLPHFRRLRSGRPWGARPGRHPDNKPQ